MRRSQRLDVSPSTIETWIGAQKEHTIFRCRGAEATTIYPPEQTIRSIKLYLRQAYAFALSPLEAHASAPQSAAPTL